ncbi:MAG: hypothetical protein KH452_06640 [Clostridiales bacterium]|nr:hypothetical protein [Clostridiales bacterium]
MKTKLLNNLLLKILSVMAAVVLWLIVVNIDDAVTHQDFKNIKVNMVNTDILSDQNQMYRVEEGTDTVNLRVYARRSVLKGLKASDFVATADMQKNLRYDSMVKIEVTCTKDVSIESIEQSRTNVLVSIEESVTEQFKVTVETKGYPSDGLVVGSKIPEQTLVEITGPVSVVGRIKKVQAEVNIAGITGTTVRSCRLKLLDGNEEEIDGTYLKYIGKDTDFDVTVTTLKKKLVGISFDVSTAAPEGYGLSSVAYKPETVNIAGEKSKISPIYNLNIPAEALNPNRETGKVEQTVDISQYLPSDIIIPDVSEHEIVVTMQIDPVETMSHLVNPDQIVFENLEEGLTPDTSETGTLEVVISGLRADLDALDISQIRVSADMSEYTRAGNYAIPVTVTLPDTKCSAPEGLEIQVRLVREE